MISYVRGKVMIMVVPFKFKSFGQGEKGYMGHTNYELSVVSASSPGLFVFVIARPGRLI